MKKKSDNKIVLISDIKKEAEFKKKELAYYKARLEQLHTSKAIIDREINLTEDLLRMVESGQ
jgi:hypothetical protein